MVNGADDFADHFDQNREQAVREARPAHPLSCGDVPVKRKEERAQERSSSERRGVLSETLPA